MKTTQEKCIKSMFLDFLIFIPLSDIKKIFSYGILKNENNLIEDVSTLKLDDESMIFCNTWIILI